MKTAKKSNKKAASKKKKYSILPTSPDSKFLLLVSLFHILGQTIIFIFSKEYSLWTMLAISLIPVLLLCLATYIKALKILKYPTWIFISYHFASFIVILINTAFKEFITNNTYISIISFVFFILFLGIFIFVPRIFFKKSTSITKELGLKELPTWTDITLAIIGFAAYIILSAILTKIFELLPFFDATQAQGTLYDPGLLFTIPDRLMALITIAVIPPIIEELVFRGWLYQKLRQNIKKFSIFFSILITSILFGFMHGQWNVGVGVFAMSVVSCLIRELTGTVYGSILLHMIANFVAFYLVFILQV